MALLALSLFHRLGVVMAARNKGDAPALKTRPTRRFYDGVPGLIFEVRLEFLLGSDETLPGIVARPHSVDTLAIAQQKVGRAVLGGTRHSIQRVYARIMLCVPARSQRHHPLGFR